MENGTRDHEPGATFANTAGIALGKLARGSHQQTFLPTAPRTCLFEHVERASCSRSCRIHTHLEGEKERAGHILEMQELLPTCSYLISPPFQIGGKIFCMLPTSPGRPRLNRSHRHRDRAESGNRDWLFQLLLLLLPLGTNCSLLLPLFPPSKCMEIWRRRRESP